MRWVQEHSPIKVRTSSNTIAPYTLHWLVWLATDVADQLSELFVLMTKGASKYDQGYRVSKSIVSNLFGVSKQLSPFDWCGSDRLWTCVQVNVFADDLKNILNSTRRFPRFVFKRCHFYIYLSHFHFMCSAVMVWMSSWLAEVYMPSITPRSNQTKIRYLWILRFVFCLTIWRNTQMQSFAYFGAV